MKRIVRYLSTAMVVAIMLAVFTACTTTNSSTPESTSNANNTADSPVASTEPDNDTSASGPYKFGFSVQGLENPFFVSIENGLKLTLRDGDELVVYSAQYDQNKQNNDINDLIQEGVDLIFLNCVDSSGITPALKECQKANIPVIAVDTPVEDMDLVAAVVASDNYQAGVVCAEAIGKALDGKGEVGAYLWTPNAVSRNRGEGFLNTIAEKYPDIKVVNTQEGQGTVEEALPVAENMLQANPEIDAFFALNDPSAIGIISAIKSAGKSGEILVVGVDGSEEAKELISKGEMFGTAAQFPNYIGEYAVNAAYDLLEGKTIEKNVVVPVEFIDATNLDSVVNQ